MINKMTSINYNYSSILVFHWLKFAYFYYQLVDKVDIASHEYGLEISTKKIKVLVASSVKIPVNITCNSATLEQVEQFCYLGSIITETSDCHKEILTRLGIARSVLTSLNCRWKDRALSMSLKCRLLQTLVWPVASYGSESWTLKVADKKRLEAFEITAYRRMMRISWTVHRTNQSILDELSPSHRFLTTI